MKLEQKFRPTPDQKEFVQSIWRNDITVCTGSAGVGKTAMTLQTFLDLMEQNHINKIICIRLVSDTCDEHLGALPGEISQKLSPFLAPIIDNLRQLITPAQIDYLISKEKLEVIPVSLVRGRTFANCGVLVDEAQNMSDHMILTVLTRIGEKSRMVICGDPEQVDIPGRNGIVYARKLIHNLDGIGEVYLDDSNIRRHPLIGSILKKARELKLESQPKLLEKPAENADSSNSKVD
jgi:phosphate starvation-inducible PhoH-like protein